jgi:hypothetical protein
VHRCLVTVELILKEHIHIEDHPTKECNMTMVEQTPWAFVFILMFMFQFYKSSLGLHCVLSLS